MVNVMKKQRAVLLCLLASVIGCSGGSSSQNSGTVYAQSGYSNASLSGTYSVQFVSPYSKIGSPFYDAIGTIVFNGAGAISGGTIDTYFSGNATPCVYSASGTYALQSTAAGTASVSLATTTPGCAVTATYQLALQAASSGSAVQFGASDGNIFSGSAVKQ
jgi:hypothetical protein